jgi:hypothetical protein
MKEFKNAIQRRGEARYCSRLLAIENSCGGCFQPTSTMRAATRNNKLAVNAA